MVNVGQCSSGEPITPWSPMIKFPANAEFSTSELALAAKIQANADFRTRDTVNASQVSDKCGLFVTP